MDLSCRGWDRRALLLAFGACIGSVAVNAHQRMTTRQVVRLLFLAETSARPDLSGRDLSELDLSGLDFKAALMRNANLFGVDLTSADLRGADLSGARLDRATVVKADFRGTQMARASLLGLSAFTGLSLDLTEVPNFAGADLSHAKLLARVDGADFRGAKLTETAFAWGPFARRPRGASLVSCRFDSASAVGANFVGTRMKYCKFRNADLRRADFKDADLSSADLSGADIAHANFEGANLADANLSGVSGRARALGLKVD